MKAVIMAGGEGTRLRPITEDVPKPFVRIAGRPTIEYVLDRLKEADVTDVLVTTFYKPWPIMERLSGGHAWDLRIFYSIEDEALGTAGGVRKLRELLDDTFVVTSGDVLADVDIKRVIEFHKERGAVATMALTEVEDPSEFGVVATDDEGRITRFQEKPKREEAFSNMINAGIYVLEPEALDRIPAGEKFDFSKQLFPKLLDEGAALYATPVEGLWMDVGRPSDLLVATDRMAERRLGGPLREDADVHERARVESSHLYKDVKVAEDATVEGSVLYETAQVGAGATVRGSVLCHGSVVEDGAEVVDSVLGRGARVAKGQKVRDLRLGGGETAE